MQKIESYVSLDVLRDRESSNLKNKKHIIKTRLAYYPIRVIGF